MPRALWWPYGGVLFTIRQVVSLRVLRHACLGEGVERNTLTKAGCGGSWPVSRNLLSSRTPEFFIDNLLVRIHLIIVMIRWTGLAPWEFEFHFPGSLTSTFLESSTPPPPQRAGTGVPRS